MPLTCLRAEFCQAPDDMSHCNALPEIQKSCWLCDHNIEVSERNVQCDYCSIHYHVKCMNFVKMEQILSKKSVTWVCLKCGRSTYSESLLYEFGFPTDVNTFQMAVQEIDMERGSIMTRMGTGSSKDSKIENVSRLTSNTCSGDRTRLTKVHVNGGTINEQTGGYSLRKKKGQTSNGEKNIHQERVASERMAGRDRMCTSY